VSDVREIPLKLYCPRCKAEDVIDLGITFRCAYCHLSFKKKSLGVIRDDEILSEEELSDIRKILREYGNVD
jgi:transposase-like protein